MELWKRIVYPIVGLVLVMAGIVLWLLPVVPGFFLIIIGLPMLFSFHPPLEVFMRRFFHKISCYMKERFKKKKD